MKLIAILYSSCSAILNTIQAGANAQLHKESASPVFTALVVYGSGLVVLLVAAGVMQIAGYSIVPRGPISTYTWWSWLGGLMGLTFVFAMLLFADQLGAATFSALTLSVGMVTSALLDHFGLVGFKVHELNWERGLACLFLIAGAILMAKF